jgi:hypothetical protein
VRTVRGLFSGGRRSDGSDFARDDDLLDLLLQEGGHHVLSDTLTEDEDHRVGAGVVRAEAAVDEQSARQHGVPHLEVRCTRAGHDDNKAVLDLELDAHGSLLCSR